MSPHDSAPPHAPRLLRCLCGRLVAELHELCLRTKCQRCKRQLDLPLDGRDDLRCPCSRLLARAHPEGTELKCPRCKRALLVGRDGTLRG